MSQGDFDTAYSALSQVAQLFPSHGRAWNNLGVIALRRGDETAAVEAFERAIIADKMLFEPHCNLAVVCHQRGQIESAVKYFERARSLAPHDPVLLCNLAMALWESGDYEQARQIVEKCICEHPNHNDAQYLKSYFSLAYGEFEVAWAGYEFRKRQGTLANPLQIPKWRGEDLSNKRILITPEQGLGEQLLFASCIPEVRKRTRQYVIVCTDKLKRLYEQSFPGNLVLGLQESSMVEMLTKFDYQVPIVDLGRILRRHLSDFPKIGDFLRADPSAVHAWKKRFFSDPHIPRIGLAWRGGTRSTAGALRSIELRLLYDMLRVSGVEFVNLQHTNCDDEIQRATAATGASIQSFPLSSSDYSEMAALVSSLDLVISVDTSVVFLCAGLGVPAWVLLPVGPNWVYQVTGESSPWLPGLKLFRQKKPNNWESVVASVVSDLSSFTCNVYGK